MKDLSFMKERMKEYVEKGRAIGFSDVREEPVIAVKPEKSNVYPLRKMQTCDVHFMAETVQREL